MKIRYVKSSITAAAVLMLIGTTITTSAQKMKTDIPPERHGADTDDQVPRLGELLLPE